MPLEALRYPVTPVGLHYLLIHYDIPAVDPATYRLTIDGHVEQPLELTLDDRRALLSPRPISQPWLIEAVGNASWLGTALAPLLAEARPAGGALEVVFTGI